ncbi:MAG: hypothetical protein ACI9W4_000940 [Rhodothermales bacterium]|jgi:hypothetical protein
MEAHRADGNLDVDGYLDESDWGLAQPAMGFLQAEPEEGLSASQRTEVRVLYDQYYVYIGAVLFDDQPELIERRLGRRDDLNRADWFLVSVDSYLDRKTAFVFGVSAAGVQYDAIDKGQSSFRGRDESWNAIWTANVQLTAEGWVVEMRIPYSMLRFTDAPEQRWGIHFERKMPRRGEDVQWPLVPRAEQQNRIAQYSILAGLNNIKPKSNLQVRPYSVGRLRTEESADTPGTIARSGNADFGGDIKAGIGSQFILDATINPDFGQVDADPAELNLTAFETFFQERRPFFVEGAQLFDFSMGRGADLLYTRRIGARDPIVGAAKLSGRTSGGLSFGVLGASTGSNFSPDRHFGVLRASQQVGSYSSIGGMLTGTDLPTDDGRSQSVTGGSDWDARVLDNAYSVTGYASFTHRLPAAADSETGFAASLRGSKREGTWRYGAGGSVFDDAFNPNDLGSLRRNNYISVDGNLSRDFYGVPGTQRFEFFVFSGQTWSYLDGLNQGAYVRLRLRANSNNFQRIGLDVNLDDPFGGYDPFESRGLGPKAEPRGLELHSEFQTDERRTWRGRNDLRFGIDDDGGLSYGIAFQGDVNLGTRFTLRGEVDFKWEDNELAWSSNESFLQSGDDWFIGEDSGSPEDRSIDEYIALGSSGLDQVFSSITPFDETGAFYVPVFGERDTRSMDLNLRGGVTFTRNLSMQFYGQLFAARGRYQNFQVLQDADNLAAIDAYPKRDEFGFGRFQTNTVLRWEYRPGSTLFVVWSQGRRSDDELNPLSPDALSPFDTPTGEQLSDTFGVIPTNAFQVKLNYTFLR